MKQRYSWIFFCIGLLLSAKAGAQVTGTVNVPSTTYPDLASIIAALNTQGVGAGGATIVLTAGFPQTAPAGGYQLGSTLLNASTSATSKLRILGNGNLITAPVGTSTGADGIFFIKGVDFLTIDNLGLVENGANSTPTTAMEWGYAMVNLNGAAPFDGCQNDTIRNCTITLNRSIQTPSRAIYSGHHVSTTNVALTALGGTADLHSNNKFYSNNISNAVMGIYLLGLATATVAQMDQNNDVGGSSTATGNTFTNILGSVYPSNSYYNNIGAISGLYQNNFNASYNSISNQANGGVPAAGATWGIYGFGAGASFTMNNNSITLAQASAAAVTAYGLFVNGTGNILTASNNTVAIVEGNGGYTTGVQCNGINHVNFQTSNIASNNVSINKGLTTNAAAWAIYSQPIAGATSVINANTIQLTSSAATLSQFYCIVTNAVTGSIPLSEAITNNIFSNFNTAFAGTGGYHMFIYSATQTGTKTITGNSNTGTTQSASTVPMYGIYNSPGSAPGTGNVTISDNNFSNISRTVAGGAYGIYCEPLVTSPQNYIINNNTINNITSTAAGPMFGIYANNGATSSIYQNTIGNISCAGGTVTGIYAGNNTSNNVYRNKVHTLSSGTATGAVQGINIAGGTTSQVHNNTIGSFTAPAASATTDAIIGINLSSTTPASTIGLYYNSVYLNAGSTGTNFSTSGIYQTISTTATTAAADLRNNIIINNSTPAGTGTTAALRRSASGGTNVASTTNRNIYYAGAPAANRLIMTDGTNNFQTLASYQTAAAPVDANSFTENSPFASTTGSAANFLHFNPISNTLAESSGANVSGITIDFDADIRQGNAGYTGNGTAPDIGADEFNNCAAIAVSSQPINDTACTASAADFTIAASNTGVYQWQVNTGSGFTDIANGGVYSGATAAQLVVTNPPSSMNGYLYRVIIRSGPTCPSTTSGSARLAVTPSPDATVTASGPLTICAGDTVKLTVPFGGNLSYQWKKGANNIPGATSNELPVDSSGSYTVTVTSNNGCSATSTPKVVVVNPRPTAFITYNSPISFCRGSAVVLNASVAANLTYQWYRNDLAIPGATSGFYSAIDSGGYRVVITNALNCNRSSTSLQVVVYPIPNPIISVNGLVLSLNAAFATYQWKLDNSDISGATGPTHTITSNGSYTIRVVDSNGCENISPVYYLGNLGLNGLAAGFGFGIVTYPNPASGHLTVESKGGIKMSSIAIYNSIGALIFSTTPQTDKQTIVLDSFADGIYTVRIQTATGVVTRRLEIVR